MTSAMLTTFDNPFDPFEQWDEWYVYDKQNGYDSCEKIARIATTSDQFTEEENEEEIEKAIDAIIENDVLNIYKKIKK